MKKLHIITRNIRGTVALAVLGLLTLAGAGRAATIQMETKVAGYSGAGWILVVPELRSQLGGAVRYDSSRRRWVTDRVSRGEPLRVTIRPTTSTERCRNGALTGIYSANGTFTFNGVALPYQTTTSVSRDPSFDNVHVWLVTSSGWFDKRVPIGSR
jgi:hypothetical protein